MSRSMGERHRPVAVVTGASSGIGRWTALGLVRAGLQVICVGRSRSRLQAAADWIAREAAAAPPELEIAEFGSLVSVRALGRRLQQRHPKLAMLVNNAGGIWPRREVSADGYEMTFAVNHLAPFLLTRILLPSLRDSPPSRIVTVASAAHLRARLDFEDLMGGRRYAPMRAYAQSKLANVLFTAELARRLADTGVVANSVHPGVVGTQFGDKGGLIGLAWRFGRPFLLSEEKGAAESLRTALAPERETANGVYFSGGRMARTNPIARDPATAERLWRESDALIDLALREPALV